MNEMNDESWEGLAKNLLGEVDRLKEELKSVSWVLKETMEVALPNAVAEAVRSERERCIRTLEQASHHEIDHVSWRSLLTPPSEKEGEK